MWSFCQWICLSEDSIFSITGRNWTGCFWGSSQLFQYFLLTYNLQIGGKLLLFFLCFNSYRCLPFHSPHLWPPSSLPPCKHSPHYCLCFWATYIFMWMHIYILNELDLAHHVCLPETLKPNCWVSCNKCPLLLQLLHEACH